MDAGLIILDGWGLNPDDDVRDAVAAADTPNFDRYRDAGAARRSPPTAAGSVSRTARWATARSATSTSGPAASSSRLARVGDSIARSRGEAPPDDAAGPPFFENETILSAFEHAEAHGGRVHFMGLVSDGGVHSIRTTCTHSSNSPASAGRRCLTRLHRRPGYLADRRRGLPRRPRSPRRGTRDRPRRHRLRTLLRDGPRPELGTDPPRLRRHRHREGDHHADEAVTAATESYARDTTDEFIEPTTVGDHAGLEAGDAVVFFNFRSDRARQLTRMLGDIRPEDWGSDTEPPDTRLVTMTQYDETFDLPVAYPPNQPADTLGEVLAGADMTQLRMAESEKYPHVTYFLNGGREVEFDGEIRNIVESPDVPTYDLQPEMSAAELADTAIDIIETEDPSAMVLNFANPDMVGHTGDFDAAVTAVEAVDEQLGRLVEAIAPAAATTASAPTTATPTTWAPKTTRTRPTRSTPSRSSTSRPTNGRRSAARDGGTQADLAPTMLTLMGIDRPDAMTGTPLVE